MTGNAASILKPESTVLLVGGSFNPPHDAHFRMAENLYKALRTDEVWLSFSQNPEKNPSSYASLEHRMAMARILSRYYDPSIILSGEEAKAAEKIGRSETYFILEELRRKFPDCKFIWAMGADSFAGFHTWKERDDILENYIVAVVGRPGYTEKALSSPTAVQFRQAAFDYRKVKDLRYQSSGWCYVDLPESDISSTALLAAVRAGQTKFSGHFNEVAAYIRDNNLYSFEPVVKPSYEGLTRHVA